jgi:hypothetical protein
MFTAHSAESEHRRVATGLRFRAMRGIADGTPIPAAHATGYRRDQRVARFIVAASQS